MMRRSREAKSQNAVVPAAVCGDDASADASDSLVQQRADAFVELVCNGGAGIETELRCAPCHRRRHAREDGDRPMRE
jgi:hypothetical protein